MYDTQPDRWDSLVSESMIARIWFCPIILYLTEIQKSPEYSVLVKRRGNRSLGGGGVAERLVLSFPSGKIQQRLLLNGLTCSPVMQTDGTWERRQEAATVRTEDRYRWTDRQTWGGRDRWMMLIFTDSEKEGPAEQSSGEMSFLTSY